MDGIVAMEGQGPRSGDPKRMNVILIGTNPFAVDTVFARLVNINPRLVPCLAETEKIYNEILNSPEKMKTAVGSQNGNVSESRNPEPNSMNRRMSESSHLNPSGFFDISELEILGDPIDEFIDPSFKIDRNPVRELSDTSMLRFTRNLLIKKPKMIPERCIKCGSCVQVCPTSPKSVDFTSPAVKTEPPVFNYATCIRCYCCHEVCPSKAIELRSFF
jgi:Pyruvate/2-oxoacid:ferredoxin oxidoreductase delta subunit